mmetsp:Transcript_58281/g.155163  ORF Transcript_58281/g.155163 Transcript_58281/m.155163 type:complete len:281 (-) Transcript_58281:543-1385(-)
MPERRVERSIPCRWSSQSVSCRMPRPPRTVKATWGVAFLATRLCITQLGAVKSSRGARSANLRSGIQRQAAKSNTFVVRLTNSRHEPFMVTARAVCLASPKCRMLCEPLRVSSRFPQCSQKRASPDRLWRRHAWSSTLTGMCLVGLTNSRSRHSRATFPSNGRCPNRSSLIHPPRLLRSSTQRARSRHRPYGSCHLSAATLIAFPKLAFRAEVAQRATWWLQLLTGTQRDVVKDPWTRSQRVPCAPYVTSMKCSGKARSMIQVSSLLDENRSVKMRNPLK